MTTYEELVLEKYYMIKGFLVALNLNYPAPVARPGGKGRGEIDLLAVKIDNNKASDVVRCEIGVSILNNFPFLDKSSAADEIERIIKKFFSKGAEMMIQNEYNVTPNINLMVTSIFHKDVIKKIEDRIKELNENLLSITMTNNVIVLEIDHQAQDPSLEISGVKTIEIIEFNTVVKEFKQLLEAKGLMTKHFLDYTLRSLQHRFLY